MCVYLITSNVYVYCELYIKITTVMYMVYFFFCVLQQGRTLLGHGTHYRQEGWHSFTLFALFQTLLQTEMGFNKYYKMYRQNNTQGERWDDDDDDLLRSLRWLRCTRSLALTLLTLYELRSRSMAACTKPLEASRACTLAWVSVKPMSCSCCNCSANRSSGGC